MEAGPFEALGRGIHLAVIDLGVEVAERLGGWLDALVRDPCAGEERAREVVVTRRVGLSEGADSGHQFVDLRGDVRDVVGDRLVRQFLVVCGNAGGATGDGELGDADG